MLEIDEIYFFKKTSKTGTFSVKFVKVNSGKLDLFINNIKLDLDHAAEPITYFNNAGTPLISGNYFDMIKRQLLKIFKNEIYNEEIGLYKFINGKVIKE